MIVVYLLIKFTLLLILTTQRVGAFILKNGIQFGYFGIQV